MTISATRAAWALLPSVAHSRIYRAPRAEVFAATAVPTELTWVQDPRLVRYRLRLSDGPSPATLDCELAHRRNAAITASVNPLARADDLDPTGTTGPVPTPDGWQRFDVVKLCLAEPGADDEVCKYVGYLVDWTEDLETGIVTLHFEDHRCLLSRIVHRGAWWVDLTQTPVTRTWIEHFVPEFNPRGKPNLYRYYDLNATWLAFVDEASSAAVAWQRGIAWNYLRRYHSVELITTGDNPIANVRNWLDWSEASSGGWGSTLFGDDASVPDLGQGGGDLCSILDALIRRRADCSWTLGYDGTSGRARFVLFGTGSDSLTSEQQRVSFARGDVGDKPATGEPEVVGGRLTHSARRTALRQYGLGARKRFDVTLDTVAGTLEQGWTAADQAAWIALDDDERGKQYPHVFLRWVAAANLNWASTFGWAANLVRARQGGGELESGDYSDPKVKIRMLVWRSTSAGAPYTWERVPAELHCSPARGVLGVEFPQGAREEREWVPDDGEDFFTWDGNDGAPAVYQVRVTISVEADERVNAWNGGDFDEWPDLERMLIDDGYEYQARRDAYLLCDGSGNPVASGGTETLKGSGADDEIRDDTGKLSDACTRLASQRVRTTVEGSIRLRGLRGDLSVGDYVVKLVSGGDDGTRPDWNVEAPIRALTFDALGQEPTTSVEVLGV